MNRTDSMASPERESDERDERVNQVIVEYLRAEDRGEALDPHEWLNRYPELAPELETFFADHRDVDRLTHPRRAAHVDDTVAWSAGSSSASAREIPAASAEGHLLGDYEIVEELGRG